MDSVARMAGAIAIDGPSNNAAPHTTSRTMPPPVNTMGSGQGSKNASMRSLARRTLHLSVPGLGVSSNKSLFIFSEDNIIRKYAKIIIEWGYPSIMSSHMRTSMCAQQWWCLCVPVCLWERVQSGGISTDKMCAYFNGDV